VIFSLQNKALRAYNRFAFLYAVGGRNEGVLFDVLFEPD
jgi:hypothetical protein